jgi:23S rRNA pseudouridine2605 synthase
MRLNKYLAHATGISRREADGIISAGRVFINGTKASLGAQVEDTDRVEVDHNVVTAASQHTYVLLNKPVGYLCSRRSQGGVPTIFTLLPAEYQALKPVGRLDKDSSGLILLTNDGDFAHRMTHPSFHKVKVYEVELDKPLQPLHQQMISDYGIALEDGISQFMVERLSEPTMQVTQGGAAASEAPTSFPEGSAFPAERGDTSWQMGPSAPEGKDGGGRAGEKTFRITMHEGRNRQIRRTFAALGYTVTKLHRTNFGNYSLGDIKTGEYTLVDIS